MECFTIVSYLAIQLAESTCCAKIKVLMHMNMCEIDLGYPMVRNLCSVLVLSVESSCCTFDYGTLKPYICLVYT